MQLIFKWVVIVVLANFSLISVSIANDDFLDAVTRQNLTKVSDLLSSLSVEDRSRAIESKFENGDTALLYAAREQNIDLYDLLVGFGANPDAMDTSNRDVLNIAIRLKNLELARHAIAAGNDVQLVTSRFEGSALIYASHQAQVEIVKLLIAAGAPLDRVNNIGWTALLEATVLGDGSTAYQDIVAALVDAGADRSIADNQGLTPLDHATQRAHQEIINILSAPAGE